MTITVPANLATLSTWWIATMTLVFALGLTAGMLYTHGKLRDAQTIAAVIARYSPEAAADLGITTAPAPGAALTAMAAATGVLTASEPAVSHIAAASPAPKARTRFERHPGEFPLLQNNPLVPLLTRPKTCAEPARRGTDRYLLITTTRGQLTGAAFLPA